jgi:hypothetical protein
MGIICTNYIVQVCVIKLFFLKIYMIVIKKYSLINYWGIKSLSEHNFIGNNKVKPTDGK